MKRVHHRPCRNRPFRLRAEIRGPCDERPPAAFPMAGVCTDETFLRNDHSKDILFDPECVWKMEEVQRTPDEVLVFPVAGLQHHRPGRPGFGYAFANPTDLTVTQTIALPDPPISSVIAYVFDIPEGEPLEDVAMTRLARSGSGALPRCRARPTPWAPPSSSPPTTPSWTGPRRSGRPHLRLRPVRLHRGQPGLIGKRTDRTRSSTPPGRTPPAGIRRSSFSTNATPAARGQMKPDRPLH